MMTLEDRLIDALRSIIISAKLNDEGSLANALQDGEEVLILARSGIADAEIKARQAGCIEVRLDNGFRVVKCPDGAVWEHESFHDDDETWEAACEHMNIPYER